MAQKRIKNIVSDEVIEKKSAEAPEVGQPLEPKQVRALKKTKSGHGRKYRAMSALIEKGQEYAPDEAIELALKTSPTKFDAAVEIHIKVFNKEKNVRGLIRLPGGLAKEERILAVSEKNIDDLISKVKAGKVDFDLLIADLRVMPRLAPLAKFLGPKGLMPSPKAGTAVEDIETALKERKSGKAEYRADKYNIVHFTLGRVSFGLERIKSNLEALVSHLPRRLDSVYLSTSMGPSIKLDLKKR